MKFSIGTRGSVWPGHQDTPKGSHREGGARSGAWGPVEIGRSAAEFGGLSKAEHFVCRTAESNDPTGLGLSRPPNVLSCPVEERLEDHLELLRCHYNFVRPHRALKFGRQVRTPAMQAGLGS